jgi:hypothetical protein
MVVFLLNGKASQVSKPKFANSPLKKPASGNSFVIERSRVKKWNEKMKK